LFENIFLKCQISSDTGLLHRFDVQSDNCHS
jgi:hypothetical protein